MSGEKKPEREYTDADYNRAAEIREEAKAIVIDTLGDKSIPDAMSTLVTAIGILAAAGEFDSELVADLVLNMCDGMKMAVASRNGGIN
jgi:hypothetical protein